MIRNVNDDLRGHAILATDGVIGDVDDLYFDDEDWAIRYLVVDTGKWLPGRRVLISPLAVGRPDWMGELPVNLTRARVESSPDVDTRKPVSRQHETEYAGYYGYPHYWDGGGLWGMGAYPGSLTAEDRIEDEMRRASRRSAPARSGDSHLRSCRAVMGYHIQATDGDIGHVQDLLIDDHTWAIRYLIVNTSNWWLGHQVLVAPPWIEAVSWPASTVSVNLTRQAIQHAPPFNAAARVDRELERGMYAHYGRHGYWSAEDTRAAVLTGR
jgi:sporulation protein YlmC with PRC-barrel domain